MTIHYQKRSRGVLMMRPGAGSSVPVTEYDFEMTIGVGTVSSVQYAGLYAEHSIGSSEGHFPDVDTPIILCYISYGSTGADFALKDEGGSLWSDFDWVSLTFTFSDDSSITTPAIPWHSSVYYMDNPNADYLKLFTALASRAGQTCGVTVTRASAFALSIDIEAIYRPDVGDTGQLVATVTYADGKDVSTAIYPSVAIFSSSDESVITVS